MIEILLIEDDEELQRLFTAQFDLSSGFKIVCASSAEEAIELYESFKNRPIVIADIHLKGKAKGYEVISILAKSYPLSPEVILMSGSDYDSSGADPKYFGARKLFTKPFHFEELIDEIGKIVHLRNLTSKIIKKIDDIHPCHSIGIRLQNGVDFPYYKFKGFADSFIKTEKFLCSYCEDMRPKIDFLGNVALECMCGNVIQGRTRTGESYFTEHGTFWTNDAKKLFSENDLEVRGNCYKVGYESIAIIPIKDEEGSMCYGTFQFNDFKKDIFTIEAIEKLEKEAIAFFYQISELI